MKISIHALLSAVLISISGITSSQAQSLVEYLNLPAAPLDLKTVSSPDRFTTQEVKADAAATIQMVSKDGVKWTLEIPAGALMEDTTITMTDLEQLNASILDPISGAYGIRLEPSGLEFKIPAKLKIELKNEIPLNQYVPASGQLEGKELQLAMIDLKAPFTTKTSTLLVPHFSIYSIYGSLTAREAIFRAANSLTADRLGSWFANQALRAKQGETFDPEFISKTLKDAFDLVIKQRLLNIQSCEGGRRALSDHLTWQRQDQLMGLDLDQSFSVPYATTATTRTAQLCLEEYKKACYQDHRPFDVLMGTLGFERQRQLMGIEQDPIAAQMVTLAVKCSSFEFKMESTITIIQDSGKEEYSLTALAEGKTELEHIFLPPLMTGKIKIVDVKMADDMGCTLTRLDAPEKSALMTKIFMNDIRFEQSLGVFMNPFEAPSNGHFMCKIDEDTSIPMSIPGTPQPTDIFGGFFMMLHSQPTSNEFNKKTGKFEFFKWNVLYGEKFAEKKYKRSMKGLKEDTVITVYHRPKK